MMARIDRGDRRNLALRYRPETFDEFVGQKEVVTYLRNSILGGQVCKHILIKGPFGSGKTRLVNVYAKALNCASPAHGSPCRICESCRATVKTDFGLFEYDTPAAKQNACDWIDHALRMNIPVPRRVLFFEEAHWLTPAAMGALLIIAQDPPPNVSFAFATTDASVLDAALLSRLQKFRVHTLPPKDAVGLLARTADAEGIRYERAALYLIARNEYGHPRDMLLKLGEVAEKVEEVTTEAVRAAYDVEDLEQVREYLLALSSDDPARPIQIFQSWSGSLGPKIDWIRMFLAHAYYRDVLGHDVSIHPLIDLIEERGAIVRQFQQRLGVDQDGLQRFWQRLIEFWISSEGDEALLQLRLARFEYIARTIPAETDRAAALDNLDTTPPASELKPDNPQAPCGDFISRDEVYTLINRASFFAQHFKRLMNVAFVINPFGAEQRGGYAAAVSAALSFCQMLEEASSGLHAGICVIERHGSSVVAYATGFVAEVSEQSLKDLCRRWGYDLKNGSVTWRMAKSNNWSFHHREILRLCAGFEDDRSHDSRKLLRDLDVPEIDWREPRALRQPVRYFGQLRDAAIEAACIYNMAPVSALNAERLDMVRGRWELGEYVDRTDEIDRRRLKVQEIEDSLEGSDRAFALKNLHDKWGHDPLDRSRRKPLWSRR